MTVTSLYQREANAIEVLLPDNVPDDPTVVIFLPVNIGTKGQWGCPLVEVAKTDLHRQLGIIAVAPAFDQDPWMGDHPNPPADGRPWVRQRAYVEEVVIPLIDQWLKYKSKQKIYLVGFSKSAPAALAMAIGNHTWYGGVGIYDNADPQLTDERFHTWGLAAVYDNVEHYLATGPLARIAAANSELREGALCVVVAAGSTDYEGVSRVRAALEEAEIPHQTQIYPGMGHAWGTGWLEPLLRSLIRAPAEVETQSSPSD